jgi:hypothetical protein
MIFKEKIFKALVLFILLFNIIDIAISTKYIKYGSLSEDNPLMETLLNMNSLLPFILLKSFLICGGLYILYKRKDKLLAQLGIYLCFCLYWGLIVHFYYFLLIK